MNLKLIAGGMALGLAAAVLAGPVSANEPYLPRGEKVFGRMDANKDGKINLAEISPVVERRFLKYDGNGDSTVSAAEIDKALWLALEKRRVRMMTNMDSDANGSISKAELDKYVSAMLNGADTDHDGGVTLAEASAFKIAKWRKTLTERAAN